MPVFEAGSKVSFAQAAAREDVGLLTTHLHDRRFSYNWQAPSTVTNFLC